MRLLSDLLFFFASIVFAIAILGMVPVAILIAKIVKASRLIREFA